MAAYTERDLRDAYENGRFAGYEEGYHKGLAVRDMELSVLRAQMDRMTKTYADFYRQYIQPYAIPRS